jgi:catechol 2,3-dioxygenase-like lactoylglutathione lyase family enzyme
MMHVDSIDHFVLTVASIERACAFYERVLGMTTVSFGDGRKAVAFGSEKSFRP